MSETEKELDRLLDYISIFLALYIVVAFSISAYLILQSRAEKKTWQNQHHIELDSAELDSTKEHRLLESQEDH